MLMITADDWLIILPTILSVALIGPSYRSQYFRRKCAISVTEQI